MCYTAWVRVRNDLSVPLENEASYRLQWSSSRHCKYTSYYLISFRNKYSIISIKDQYSVFRNWHQCFWNTGYSKHRKKDKDHTRVCPKLKLMFSFSYNRLSVRSLLLLQNDAISYMVEIWQKSIAHDLGRHDKIQNYIFNGFKMVVVKLYTLERFLGIPKNNETLHAFMITQTYMFGYHSCLCTKWRTVKALQVDNLNRPPFWNSGWFSFDVRLVMLNG